jgi:hypothetical protein
MPDAGHIYNIDSYNANEDDTVNLSFLLKAFDQNQHNVVDFVRLKQSGDAIIVMVDQDGGSTQYGFEEGASVQFEGTQSSYLQINVDRNTTLSMEYERSGDPDELENSVLYDLQDHNALLYTESENSWEPSEVGVLKLQQSVLSHGDTQIEGFSPALGNIIDISDLLFNYDPLTDAITDFVKITNNGKDSALLVDSDGGADNFVPVAQLHSVTGLTDEEALVTNGNLIVV